MLQRVEALTAGNEQLRDGTGMADASNCVSAPSYGGGRARANAPRDTIVRQKVRIQSS